MKQLRTAWNLITQGGPRRLFSHLGEFLYYRGRALNRSIFRVIRARLEWKRTERVIEAKPASEERNLEWGKARYQLYRKWGSLPCPGSEMDRLESLRDQYKGKRIFIIGNGPSLNNTPLEKLKDEYTFGLNRIYLMFDRIDWRPTFYTVIDWQVGPDIATEVNGLDEGMKFFFPERFRGLLKERDTAWWYWLKSGMAHRKAYEFSMDPREGFYEGNTVAVPAIQLAALMGFDPIYLIGTDVSYQVKSSVSESGPTNSEGKKHCLQSTEDDDPNHFDPRYFGAGRRWSQPNPNRMVMGFDRSGRALKKQGRHLYNATVGGCLEVLERVDFNSLFD